MRTEQVRERNRAAVLAVLRTDGPTTKAALSARIGLSTPTVADILGDFERTGVVVITGAAPSTGGRRPAVYQVQADAVLGVGLNVNERHIDAVVADLAGDVHVDLDVACDLSGTRQAFIRDLVGALDDVLAGLGDAHAVAGIGVAVPSTMHQPRRGVFTPAGRTDWDGIDLPATLREVLPVPVVAENRTHAVAIGEHLFGAAAGVDDLLCLVVGAGLGGAVINAGRLQVGGGGAGALGRMILADPDADQPRPVSSVVSGGALAATMAARMRAASRRRLHGTPAGRLSADDVIDAGLAGDELAVAVLANVGRCLGTVVAATLCVSDSSLVLVCGPTARAGELLLGPLRTTAGDRFPFKLPDVRVGSLGARAGPLGASALVLRDLVQGQELAAPLRSTTPTTTPTNGRSKS